jgi:predicted dehydrogenase
MNVLVVGLGSIAAKHVNAIQQIDKDAHIYALRSKPQAEKKEGITNLYSLDEANAIKFDFGIISNPTSEHKKTIDALLVLKCPLFIEKPVSNTVKIQDTIAEIQRLGVLTYIACNLRFLDSLQYVKKAILNNEMKINEVNVYCGSYLPEWRPNVDFRASYSAQKDMGGGVQFDLIHEIDYVYWIFGKPQNVNKTFRNASSLQIDAVDYAHYCLEYEDFCVGITLNYYRRDYKRTMEILLDDCTWLLDLKQNIIISGETEIFRSAQQISDTYLEQMKYFYQLIQTEAKSSFNSIYEAVETLKIGI